jgi:hypothetical protein
MMKAKKLLFTDILHTGYGGIVNEVGTKRHKSKLEREVSK